MDLLIPELVNKGSFGNIKLISYCANEREKGAPNHSSIVNFATLICEKGCLRINLDIVIKTQLTDPKEREFRDCNQMFQNECSMYNVIIPKIGANILFPKLFYSNITEGGNITQDIIILENLSQSGFHTANNFFLDFEHLSLAIKKLAFFHSLSYIYKIKHLEMFKLMVQKLKEPWFSNDLPRNIKVQSLSAIRRGVEPLIKQGYEEEILTKFLDSFEDLFDVVKYLKAPEEFFGVICHGDFIQNNMTFKYEGNIPYDFKMFDLQNSSYSTPTLDLSTLLYTNTTKETRDKHWDNLLSMYWKEFTSCLPDDMKHPSFEEFLNHFAKKAVYGYICSSFVVPMMVSTNTVKMKEYKDLSDNEKGSLFMKSGGKTGTQFIVDIVIHMLNRKYIHEYLKNKPVIN